MCVKHAGVHYQHFASDSLQGEEKKEHFLHFWTQCSPELWKEKEPVWKRSGSLKRVFR